MRVNDGTKMETRRRCQVFRSVDLEGMVVRRGEKGEGIKRVEGEMRDTVFVR